MSNNSKIIYKELEETLASWINEKRAAGAAVSSKSIILKAKEIARERNLADFKASKGWFRRFLNRTGLSFRRITSSGRELPQDVAKTCETFIQNCSQSSADKKTILNMDETSIYLDSPGKISTLFLYRIYLIY
jgi:hypothetical protein